MNHFFIVTITAALITVLGAGCAKTNSSSVTQSQIYTTYQASYRYGGSGYAADSSTPILSLSATFNLAGSTGTYLLLDGPSQVTVNGAALSSSVDIINQVEYKLDKSGATDADANQSFAFVYTDNDNKPYANTITLPPAIMVTNLSGTTYPLTSTLHVGWSSASAVTSAETLTANVENIDGNYFASSQSGTVTGTSGDITVETGTLKSVKAGAAFLSICRAKSSSAIQAPTAGGSITTTRCSAKVRVAFQ